MKRSRDCKNHKSQATNPKQIKMTKNQASKQYDLEERTLNFAKEVIEFAKTLPRSTANAEITKQVIRSSGSIGANYIEANESLSKKDFVMRIKICRKESKESSYWLKLAEVKDSDGENRRRRLIEEATELTKIFSSIAEKSI
jgi:four helix bundle protein